MNFSTIPPWNAQGVLPPVNPASPVSVDRSPYLVPLADLILQYGTSPDRQAILKGLLGFRQALHQAGLVHGFQWLNGSFLEHIESIESRPPKDIDVVTFYHPPLNITEESLVSQNPRLFNAELTKEDYRVDAHFVQLDPQNTNSQDLEYLIELTTYWYSVWSHRRDYLWKGYLQIELAPDEDSSALENLLTIKP
ncbi:MAG: hypothetical protein HQK60_07880 [Deltaproteobacteria bacterium]|nr:hypothetical protein [Deltaproteobacteria bacterium]